MSKTEMEAIRQATLKLRADLAATNLALMSLLTAMPPDQRQAALDAMAASSAEKQQFAEQLPTQAARDTVKPLQEAEARLFQALQGAHRIAQQRGR